MYHSTAYGSELWRKRLEEYQERLRKETFEILLHPWEKMFVQGFIEGAAVEMIDCTPIYKPPENDVGMNPEAG